MNDRGYNELDNEFNDQLDDEVAGEREAADAAPQLVFGSVDEFVRVQLSYTYMLVVGPHGQRRWSAQWRRSGEATSRLESLWRAWEHLRQDGTTGMSEWWRDHLDHHMPVLMSAGGPFADSTDTKKPGEPLPYSRPPAGVFPDVRPQHPTGIGLSVRVKAAKAPGYPAASAGAIMSRTQVVDADSGELWWVGYNVSSASYFADRDSDL